MRPGPPRRFFHISPDHCGAERVVQLFRWNRLPAACHEEGRLAEDLAHAHAAGMRPLAGWPRARLLAGLYRLHRIDRDLIEGWRLFPWLDAQFPDAVFILTTRDPDGWIADRLIRDDGRMAHAYAHHLRVPVSALPAVWAADWQAHQAAVSAHFGADPRLVRADIDRETPADLCDRLAAFVDLPRRPAARHWLAPPDPAASLRLLDRVEDDRPPLSVRRGRGDPVLAREIADFCLRGLDPARSGGNLAGVSALYAHWDGRGPPRRRDGHPWPVAIGPDLRSGAMRAHAVPGVAKLERLEGVVNDILSLGRRDAVHVDMEDHRWIGADPAMMPDVPVLCHNRRAGARNAVLWPLPGWHTLGLPGFARPETPDTLPWEDKHDRLVWRGNLSGTVPRPEGQPRGPGAHSVLAALEAAGDDPAARARLRADLDRLPRLDFVRRHIGDPGMDVGLVMAWGYRRFAADPFIAPFVRPFLPQSALHRFRYQLCLTGYDHATGFIGALNSRCVLLAAEDGWEVFYSGMFQPWKHYIPIGKDAADIHEKLQMARENQSLCKEISQNARARVAQLADAALLDRVRSLVLDGIAAQR